MRQPAPGSSPGSRLAREIRPQPGLWLFSLTVSQRALRDRQCKVGAVVEPLCDGLN